MAGRDFDGSVSPPRVPPCVDLRGPLPRELTTAQSPSPPLGQLQIQVPRRGSCCTVGAPRHAVGPSEELAPLPRDGQLRDSRHPDPSSASAETAPLPAPRIKSIIVAPSPGSRLASSGSDPGWTEVSSRRGRRPSADPSVGRCFRCLSKRHRLADRRDPIHCIICRRARHIAKRCPQNPRVQGRGGSARDRLRPAPPAHPLHHRFRFPPPTASTMSPLSPAMLHHLDPARRPRESRSITVPSPAIYQAVFFLRSHAITLSAADGVNATSPMAVGRALEGLLSVPVHSLRVTAHHPEHYFVIFTQPSHQVNAVRRGSIRVEGACFNIASWHEHDHATFDSLLLHVRVIIEKVPM
ncbi:hypothetical protein ZWY2020_007948 [Hordeum vulgare]|nr:hypothetical protein ZWY2020_007948 [Hordeum vulgare]